MKRTLLGLLLALSTFVPRPAHPIYLTLDKANLLQSVLVALRTLQSNYNEAKMIINQVQQLENDIKNLKNLRFDVIDEFNSNFVGLYRALGRVDGVIQHLEGLERRFEELYPDYKDADSNSISKSLQQISRSAREMIEGALSAGAHVVDALPTTQGQIESLTQASQGSVGILQATQAGNQIAATVATQLANLNAQTAAATQATSAFQMATLQKQAAAEKAQKDALKDWGKPLKAVRVPVNPLS
jgi:P-type conjugative transfer protein TrbJ